MDIRYSDNHKATIGEVELILDSGASVHMLNIHRKYFTDYEKRNDEITTAQSGSPLRCIGIGNVYVKVKTTARQTIVIKLLNWCVACTRTNGKPNLSYENGSQWGFEGNFRKERCKSND